MVVTTPAPKATPAPAVETSGKSIAVLPFENLSVDPENVYFTDGGGRRNPIRPREVVGPLSHQPHQRDAIQEYEAQPAGNRAGFKSDAGADAGLGRKEEALREGRRAVALLPLEKDALNGVRVRQFLAIIYAGSGEKELACQQLSTPLALPASVRFGELRLHPFWDPFRGEFCFEKILAGLAPKSAATTKP